MTSELSAAMTECVLLLSCIKAGKTVLLQKSRFPFKLPVNYRSHDLLDMNTDHQDRLKSDYHVDSEVCIT